MPEPSLSEIADIKSDPSQSGIAPVAVIDNSHIVDELNNNAKFHATQVANRYNTFLQNKKDLYQNIGDIEGLETLPEDKPVLEKQAADIFSEMNKNPTVVNGGQGYNEFMQKIAKYKSNAMASKQAFLEDKANRHLFETNPEMYTPENKKMEEDYIKTDINKRKAPLFTTPTIMDQGAVFEKTLKDSVEPYSDTVIKDGQHYIQTGFEFNPNTFSRQWGLVGGQTDKNNKQLSGAIKYNYDHLPTAEKEKYEGEDGGGIKQYWKDIGKTYLDAHLPPESKYEKMDNGNVRFGKSPLKPDLSYIDAQKEKSLEDYRKQLLILGKGRLSVEEANLWLRRQEFALKNTEISNNSNNDVLGYYADKYGRTETKPTVTNPTGAGTSVRYVDASKIDPGHSDLITNKDAAQPITLSDGRKVYEVDANGDWIGKGGQRIDKDAVETRFKKWKTKAHQNDPIGNSSDKDKTIKSKTGKQLIIPN